ncbi:MAG: polysaccharide biosynthesis/export family protein [Muribaculaceae bacterium]|nr:polysaccharide biosynthesis/export family protein [Muribaculaceae bacterium]
MSNIHFNYYLCCAIALLSALGFTSCKTPKDVVYFQDIKSQVTLPLEARQLVIQPLDKLNILVNTRDPQVTDALNLPNVSRQIGMQGGSQSQGVVPYSVNAAGDIDFPFLGEIHVAGLTRAEAASMIKGMLIGAELAKDPIVTVEFVSAKVSVLGEVTMPGRYDIDSDDMTILDALGAAGDLTIYGQRDSVRVIRRNGDKQETYFLNLLSAEDLAKSPAYYVQQDDVIYVEPNPTRTRQASLNANTVLSTSFWLSMVSMAITIVAIIVR